MNFFSLLLYSSSIFFSTIELRNTLKVDAIIEGTADVKAAKMLQARVNELMIEDVGMPLYHVSISCFYYI